MLEWLSVRLPSSGTGRVLVAVIGATVVVLTSAGVYFRRRRRKHQGSVETVGDIRLPNTVVLTPFSRTVGERFFGIAVLCAIGTFPSCRWRF